MDRTILGLLVGLTLTGCGPVVTQCTQGQEGVFEGALQGDASGALSLELTYFTDVYDARPTGLEVMASVFPDDAPLDPDRARNQGDFRCKSGWPEGTIQITGDTWFDTEGVQYDYAGEMDGLWDGREQTLSGSWWLDWSRDGETETLEGTWDATRIGP